MSRHIVISSTQVMTHEQTSLTICTTTSRQSQPWLPYIPVFLHLHIKSLLGKCIAAASIHISFAPPINMRVRIAIIYEMYRGWGLFHYFTYL